MLGLYPYTVISTIPIWFCNCAYMAVWSDYAVMAMELNRNDTPAIAANGRKPYGLYEKNHF